MAQIFMTNFPSLPLYASGSGSIYLKVVHRQGDVMNKSLLLKRSEIIDFQIIAQLDLPVSSGK